MGIWGWDGMLREFPHALHIFLYVLCFLFLYFCCADVWMGYSYAKRAGTDYTFPLEGFHCVIVLHSMALVGFVGHRLSCFDMFGLTRQV